MGRKPGVLRDIEEAPIGQVPLEPKLLLFTLPITVHPPFSLYSSEKKGGGDSQPSYRLSRDTLFMRKTKFGGAETGQPRTVVDVD